LRQEFVREPDGVALQTIARLQQPAAQARLDGVQRIARGGLLNLDEEHLAVTRDDPAQGLAIFRRLVELRRGDAQCGSPDLDDGPTVRPARSYPAKTPIAPS
jgi:hypothetical protein